MTPDLNEHKIELIGGIMLVLVSALLPYIGVSGDIAWFVAIAPAEKPRLALAVLVENGGHGGSAAAPIAKKVLDAYFHGGG